MEKKWIVVYDPKGEWWEGALVEEARARSLQSRDVVVLPVVPDLFKRSGVGGYHKRSWGAGWSLDSSVPATVSPMTMYCIKDHQEVHWAARLLPEARFLDLLKDGKDHPALLNGFLRLVSDGSQAIVTRCGLLAEKYVDVRDLKSDQLVDGSFLLRGMAKVMIPGDGHYGFALYGYAPGLRVLWSAVSQA